MKTIASFHAYPPVDLLKIGLESNGIRVFLKDEFTGSIGSLGVMVGGIKGRGYPDSSEDYRI